MLLREIKIPMLRDIKVSEARNKTYWKQGTPLPTKYQKEKYGFLEVKRKSGNLMLLHEIETKKLIIKNNKSYGTPKWIKVNFQKIWNNEVSEHTRNKIALDLKESYKEALSKVEPITEGFPVRTVFTMYTTTSLDEEQDVDNLSILYIKTFHDALTQHGILPDDKLKYLKRFSSGHETAETNYIIVQIHSYDS